MNFVRICEECEMIDVRCPPSGHCAGIPKKNAWIVWIVDYANKIVDLEVYERDKRGSL